MKLLIDTQPIIVIPELATAIGLNEAIFTQQLHYWLEINKKSNRNIHDGKVWAYNTYSDWKKQFPFWSERTIKRIVSSLEKSGLLITGNYNKMKLDQTRWYTINYEMLNQMFPSCQNGTIESDNVALPIPENNFTETNTNKDIKVQKRVLHEDYLSSLCEEYGVDCTGTAIALVNAYIDGWYGQAVGASHKAEGKYKRAVFAEKLMKCCRELSIDLCDIQTALLWLLKHYPFDVDPQIYYATGSKVLGNALVQSGAVGYETIAGTEYDFG